MSAQGVQGPQRRPGDGELDALGRIPSGEPKAWTASRLFGRHGGAARPEEIARLAVFLASADADYVTGASYVMNGGLMINLGQGA